MEADVLVVGLGLAGSTLAWRLAERGISVVAVDRGPSGPPAASRVAAGLITPVTGLRLTVADDFAALRDAAVGFYRGVERATGLALFSEAPAVRLFVDEGEREVFARRLADPAFAGHARWASPAELPAGLDTRRGGFLMPGAARLDVPALLAATAEWLAGAGRLAIADLQSPGDVVFTPAGVAAPAVGLSARYAVVCVGAEAIDSPWPSPPGLIPVKGETLTIDAPAIQAAGVVHRGVWLAPAAPGEWTVGATHTPGDRSTAITDAARGELVAKLAGAGADGFRVLGQHAAVRAATRDRTPVAGFSDTRPRLAWLNGLGSKGTLWAPEAADRLASRLAERIRRG